MGTTIVATVWPENHVVLANAGDSRAYLDSDGRTVRLTKDHSWTEEMVSSGDPTAEEAASYPWRSRIARGLGRSHSTRSDIGCITVE